MSQTLLTVLGHWNKTGQFQAAHVTNGTHVSNYGTWELPQGVWLHSHFPTRISKGNVAKKTWQNVVLTRILKEKPSPKLSHGHAPQRQDRLGRGPKPRLGPARRLAFHGGWGPISKPRAQFASLIQRHLHTPPRHTARCLILDIPFVKKQKPTLV